MKVARKDRKNHHRQICALSTVDTDRYAITPEIPAAYFDEKTRAVTSTPGGALMLLPYTKKKKKKNVYR